MKKIFISYEQIHKLVKKIFIDIKNDNWIPDAIVAIASGGLIPSRILKTFIQKDIFVVGLKRYENNLATYNIPQKIQWIDEVEKKIENKKILLVDEVDDTRVTLSYCITELLKHSPIEIRVAILHQKIKEKKAQYPIQLKKVYQGTEIADEWINYPWEANDIDLHNSMVKNG